MTTSCPPEVAEAYRVTRVRRRVRTAVTTRCSAAAGIRTRSSPKRRTSEEDDGLLGDGWFRKLREAVLTPLRQLTFWHGKNQAREFGEGGAAQLVRAIMAASRRARAPHGPQLRHDRHVERRARAGGQPGRPAAPRRVALPRAGRGVAVGVRGRRCPRASAAGAGYLADVVTPAFVSGPIVATRSKWDYAVGKFYPLAVRVAGQYLLGDDLAQIRRHRHVRHPGRRRAAVELPAAEAGHSARSIGVREIDTVYNIDASARHREAARGLRCAQRPRATASSSWLGMARRAVSRALTRSTQKPRRPSCFGSRCHSLATRTCSFRKTFVPTSGSICARARTPTSRSREPLWPMMIAFWLSRSTTMLA